MSYVPYVIIVDDFPSHPNVATREIIGPFVTKYLADQYIAKHLQVPRIAWEIVPLTSQFDTERHTVPLK